MVTINQLFFFLLLKENRIAIPKNEWRFQITYY